jgi:hypothetical protein
MTSSVPTLTCALCGATVPLVDGVAPETCPQCGTAFVALTPAAQPVAPVSIPPPPAYVPPTPIIAAQPGAMLPYGELQQAGIWVAMMRRLRAMGVSNIIGGVIVIGAAIFFIIGQYATKSSADAAAGPNMLMLVVAAVIGILGVGYIAEGIWMIAAPSGTGLLVSAITSFVTTGILFLSLSWIGIVTLIYGLAQMRRYKKYGPAMSVRPSPSMEQRAKEILERLYKLPPKKAEDIIEFKAATATRRMLCRGILLDNLVVVIAYDVRAFGKDVADIHFMPPTGLIIDVKRKEFLGKALKVEVFIEDMKYKGTILPQWLDRLQAWQARYAPTASVPLPTP